MDQALIQRAQSLFGRRRVELLGDRRYVISGARVGTEWTVDLWREPLAHCTCPAFLFSPSPQRCKHVYFALLLERALGVHLDEPEHAQLSVSGCGGKGYATTASATWLETRRPTARHQVAHAAGPEAAHATLSRADRGGARCARCGSDRVVRRMSDFAVEVRDFNLFLRRLEPARSQTRNGPVCATCASS